MPVKFLNDKPIFIQLADMIKGDIISGKFGLNEKLPSVREFALIYSVNPNTVQKALQILEEQSLIITDRTNGKFVSESSRKIELEKNKAIDYEVHSFFEKMKAFGLTSDEIKRIVNKKGE